MRLAVLYDIHGNLPALDAVLEEVRREPVDQIVVGGDVYPGPMSGECLECLLDFELPVRFIRGNGDGAVLSLARGAPAEGVPEQVQEAMRALAHGLSADRRRLMTDWPATLSVAVEGLGEVLFCHATPRSDTEIFTRRTPEEDLVELFESTGADLVVCGHTHMQFDRRIGGVRVVNAGSVGMPFGEPGAYWLSLGPALELRRTDYDLTEAARRIRATEYLQADAFAERNVLHPPSEDEMLELFAGGAPKRAAADRAGVRAAATRRIS